MIFDRLKMWWERRKTFPSWHFYLTGKEGLDAMYEACEKAEESIELEQFIFANDQIGKKFCELLVRKAREGVKVRVLCDYVGSFDLYLSEWPNLIKLVGGEVRFFNVIRPWRVRAIAGFHFYFRTHRKVLIIDTKVAYVGGLGIRDDMLAWRDTHLSISGEVVAELRAAFEQIWKKSEKKTFFRLKRLQNLSRGFKVVTNSPRYKQRYIYYNVIYAIQNAQKQIRLTTPYFVPDHRFFRALQLAALRGVDVKLLIPQKSDSVWADRGARSYFKRAFKAGIEIFEYQGDFLHAKTMVVDDSWASVGSFNLDNLSFLWNYELNIETSNPKCVAELKGHFDEDIKKAVKIDQAEWEKRGFVQRLFEYIAVPFHRIM